MVAQAETSEGEIPPGTVVLGRYQVLGKLAQGGMAEVYLARQVGPGGYQKLVVCKRVRPHLSKDEDFVGMFVNEARLAAMINHPNVVQIFDLGEEEGITPDTTDWFLAMEYLDGRDMLQVGRACRSHNKAVPFDVTARIIADACAGLEHAHNLRGGDGKLLDLVHRDMSPENVIITFEGQVKVVDFGIAKARDNSIRTQAGQIKGKLGYVAPEAILGKPVDARADIFAIGATLYLFLSGRPAFTGNSPMEIFERSLKAPPSPREVNARVPPVLDEICMRALAQDRDQRYRTAGEVRMALDAYLTSTGRPLGAPQLAQFMRILFPPDKDPARQRLEKLLQDAQGFEMPKTRAPQTAAAIPRTISVPKMPAAAPVPMPSEQENTAVGSGLDRTAPGAVDLGPPIPALNKPSGGPVRGGAAAAFATLPDTASGMSNVPPAKQVSKPVPAAKPATPFRSVGVSDDIPDVSNPRGNFPPPPVDDMDDGRTHVTPHNTAENVEVVQSQDIERVAGARDALDEETMGGLDIDVSDQPSYDGDARTVAELAAARDALMDDPSEVIEGPATVQSHPPANSLPPVPPSDPTQVAATQQQQAVGFSGEEIIQREVSSSLPVPQMAPQADAVVEENALFAPPSPELVQQEIYEPPIPRPAGEISIGLKVGMVALGAISGFILLLVVLAISGNLSVILG